jgi:hypothetical protein
MRPRLLPALLATALTAAPRALVAQTEYYDLDAGRPTRVEDASPTERSELEIQLAPVRLEWVDGGMQRWRMEPKLSYGVLPFTEIELRAPLVAAPEGGQQIGPGGGDGHGDARAYAPQRRSYIRGTRRGSPRSGPSGSVSPRWAGRWLAPVRIVRTTLEGVTSHGSRSRRLGTGRLGGPGSER